MGLATVNSRAMDFPIHRIETSLVKTKTMKKTQRLTLSWVIWFRVAL